MSNIIHGNRSDLIIEEQSSPFRNNKKDIYLTSTTKNEYIYKTIHFESTHDVQKIKELLIDQLLEFINYFSITRQKHIFIVGLGNDNHTADSVGPKVLKHIKVNAHLEKLGLDIPYPKVSALEPGAMGETGIETKRIIESVVQEIKPDIIILIDSYVSKDISYLNRCIQLTNEGITPGSGLHGFNNEISNKTLGIPILVIGVPTAIEVTFDTNEVNPNTYLLSTKNIDTYVNTIAKIIGEAINESLYK